MNLSNRAGRAVFVVATMLVASLPVSLSHAQPPPNAVPVNITGEIRLSYMDDFDNERAELQYFILDQQSNRRYRLNFDGEPPPGLATGTPASVVGLADDDSNIYLAAGGVSSSGSIEAAGGAFGNQSTLVMVANFTDVAVDCPVQDIRDLMFTDPNDQSVDDAYRENSEGTLSLSGDVAGPFDIHYSSGGCSIDSWASATDKAAQAAGFNINGYSRRLYVMPVNGCGAAGYGDLGGSNTQAWIFTCHVSDVYAHELGHNFNMHHASSPSSEYGDGTDFMGAPRGRLRHVNAPHKEQMGWISGGQIQSVTKTGFYDLAPLALSAADALAPQVLKISVAGSSDDLYVSYRSAVGFDANQLSGYLDRISVHEYPGDYSATQTNMLALAADGETFTDSRNRVSVTLLSHNPDFATVEVNFDGTSTCTTASPQVALVPSSQSADAGSTLDYDVVVSNRDTSSCDSSDFALSYDLPSGWTGGIWPTSLSLAPGQSQTAVLSVTSSANSAGGTYTLGVDAGDVSLAGHTGHGSAGYTVLGACAPQGPDMSVSPSSQSGDAGTTLSYIVSLQNNDDSACDSSTFALSVGSLPSGWSASLSSQSATLAAGQGTSVTLSVTSSSSTGAGTYGVQVSTSDASEPVHEGASAATYAVEDSTPIEDLEAPTQPTGLSAKANGKRINLSWSASSDNVGVAGYRVHRDGIEIGTTPDTHFADQTAVAGTVYQYAVAAYDAAGNDSAMSAPVAAELTSNGRGRGNGNGNGNGNQ